MTDIEGRRKLILIAAERLLEHYGVYKTTVADIAREAAIGVGTVYLEFGSKDDIIGHVAGQKHHQILARLRAVAEAEDSNAARLRALLNERVRAFRGLAECGSHAADLIHCKCSPVQASWAQFRAAEREIVERILASGIEAGEFAAADPERLADTVLRAYSSFTPPRIFHVRDDGECQRRLDAMHDLILRGLSA